MITEEKKSIFKQNKEIYENLIPKWKEEFEKTGNMNYDPYSKNWIAEFTPIESSVWIDIRSIYIPFYPQVPACGFFLDFANPFKKIAIECDGQEFHDKERDSIRDKKLAADGWIVFRIPGHECNRVLPEPWDREFYDESNPIKESDISKWFNETSTGVIYAINQVYFRREFTEFANRNMDEIYRTLDSHCSTNNLMSDGKW